MMPGMMDPEKLKQAKVVGASVTSLVRVNYETGEFYIKFEPKTAAGKQYIGDLTKQFVTGLIQQLSAFFDMKGKVLEVKGHSVLSQKE